MHPLRSTTSAHTSLAIAVGFGLANPEQVATGASRGDAVVVGSTIVNQSRARDAGAGSIALDV